MISINETDIKHGQAIYTPMLLKIYNLWVVHLSNQWIWRCPKETQLAHFNQWITENHLDIGVGTGYYLKRCKWPALFQLSLMDLNSNCLAAAKKLLQQYSPKIYTADIYKPQTSLAIKCNSISMNYLLHCLPGNMQTKAIAIETAASMLIPGGILFGATILADPEIHTKLSKKLNSIYNKKKIFSNLEDTHQALGATLSKHLTDVDISVVGCVALFKGKK